MELVVKPTAITLRTSVVDILRDAIMTGQLEPGEHLKEIEIAAQLSVSRSPVREAFRQLEQEGLIVSIPNQGCFVRVFDEQDVREIFALRTALEDLACKIVLEEHKLGPEEFNHLMRYIEQQREAIRAGDMPSLTKLDMDFHEYFCSRSGYERLLKMWKGLRAQMHVLFYHRFRALQTVPQTVDIDHTAIVNALRKGDLEEFSRINHEINARVANECIGVMRALRAGTAAARDTERVTAQGANRTDVTVVS